MASTMEVLDPVRQVSKARSALGENPRISATTRGFVMRLFEEIPGGALCKEIEPGYHPPRESSIALSRDGPNLVGRRGRSTRAKKRRTQSIFSENHKETRFFDVSASDAWRLMRTQNSPY